MKKIISLLVMVLFTFVGFSQQHVDKIFSNKAGLPERPVRSKDNNYIASWGFLHEEGYTDYIAEALSDGWFSVDGDGDGATFGRYNLWCLTSSGCGVVIEFMSSFSRYYTSIFNGNPSGYADELDNWFISPEIDIPADGLCAVEWADWSFTNMNGEQYKLLISPTGDSDPSSFTYEVADVTTVNSGSSYLGMLNEFAGQTIRIAFWHYAGINAAEGGAVCAYWMDVYQINEPTLFVAAKSFYFSHGRVGEASVKQTQVIGVQLTGSITATSSNTDVYLVSSDGITFAETATLTTNGGTLYVQYTPTEIGDFENDVITVSVSGATTQEIRLSGEATDCSNVETPYDETFMTNDADLSKNIHWCWDLLNESAANTNSAPYIPYSTDEGTSISFNSNKMQQAGISYNQWAITPELHTAAMSEDKPLEYFVVAFEHSAYYYPTYNKPEKFAVGYSSTDNNFASFTFGQTQDAISRDYVEYATELPAGTKYVAIKCMTNFGYGLDVKNVSVTPIYEPSSVTGLIENQFSVYPNPAKNVINLVNATGEVQIINSLGAVVYKGAASASIDVSNLSAGTYFVKVAGVTRTISIVK